MQKLCKAKTTPPSSSTCTIGGGRSILFVEFPQTQAGKHRIAYSDLRKSKGCFALLDGRLLCGLLKYFSALCCVYAQ